MVKPSCYVAGDRSICITHTRGGDFVISRRVNHKARGRNAAQQNAGVLSTRRGGMMGSPGLSRDGTCMCSIIKSVVAFLTTSRTRSLTSPPPPHTPPHHHQPSLPRHHPHHHTCTPPQQLPLFSKHRRATRTRVTTSSTHGRGKHTQHGQHKVRCLVSWLCSVLTVVRSLC